MTGNKLQYFNFKIAKQNLVKAEIVIFSKKKCNDGIFSLHFFVDIITGVCYN